MMNIKQTKDKKILMISFILYLILLTWIVIFKCKFQIGFLGYRSSVNFIPFKNNNVSINGINETIINLMLFIPMGIYLKILLKNKLNIQIISIIVISCMFEILQYVLKMGISDITDVIMNTIGGLIGIMMISLVYKIFSRWLEMVTIDKILGYLSYIGLLFVILFILNI